MAIHNENNPQAWQDMVKGFQTEALATRLKIPMIYGIDAVHGNAHLYGATVFPQESGVAATHDPALAQEIGKQLPKKCLPPVSRGHFLQSWLSRRISAGGAHTSRTARTPS